MKTINGISITKELKDKLIALDEHTSVIWDMSYDDPEYQEHHDICKKLQEELFLMGLNPTDINMLTYGEGGVLFG